MLVIGEKYHVISSLGGGGMGAVYEALHSGTGRRVAVKMIRPELASSTRDRERFVREARIAGSLASPYVAEVLDAGTDGPSGLPFIVMELLDGPNLRDLVRERGPLPVGLVLVIAAQVASGLQEAHEAGVIHRDIKPANLVLCSARSGELVAKIVDFGVAKALDEDARDGLTRTGDLVGSLRYMSPEQLSGDPVGARSDVWSLGAVMYEALSGTGPAGDADALAAVVGRICFGEIAPLSSLAPALPRAVTDLVHRALARDPASRFASAHAMHEALRLLLPNGIRVPASVVSDGSEIVVSAAQPSRSRGPAVRGWAAVGVGLLAATGMGYVVATRTLGPAADTSFAEATSAAVPPPPPPPSPEPEPEPEPSPASTNEASGETEPARPQASAAPAARAQTSAGAKSKAPARPAGAAKANDPLDHM